MGGNEKNMIKDIKNVEIQGGFFSELAKFEIFQNENDRISIIYGKNGSGKSSIAKAISDYKNNDFSTFNHIKFTDNQDNEIVIPDKQNIFVFNEEFIEKNIKFASEGLNTIVMFGEQGDLDEQLQSVQKSKNEIESKLEIEQSNLLKYNDNSNVLNPDYYYHQIENNLKQDGNWATRDMNIKNNSRKSSVNNDIVNLVMNRTPNCDLETLNKKFKQKYEMLSQSDNATSKIELKISEIEIDKAFEDTIISTLRKKIKLPVMTDREKDIMSVIENGYQSLVEKAQSLFNDKDINTCPFCFQKLSQDYKEQVLSEISNVLNKDVEEHKMEIDKLLNYKFADIKSNLSLLEVIDNTIVLKTIEKYDVLLDKIEIYKQQLSLKKENIYSPIEVEFLDITSIIDEINSLIKEINLKIEEYNNAFENKSKLLEEAKEINLDIAYYEVESFIESFNKQVKEKSAKQKVISDYTAQLQELKIEEQSILQKRKNVGIALDIINRDLQYIFYSKDRLTLTYEDDKYKILSYGQSVKFNKISVGERNIIALCYFFTLMLDNVETGNEYKDNLLVVIDDPISSFDFENKIGIYSFIKSKLDLIMNANSFNKVMLFTHELEAMFNFNKLVGEFDKTITTTIYQFLENKTLKLFPIKKQNEYDILLSKLFNYGNGTGDESEDLSIGNAMRRVLETFSTFEFKIGIDEIARNEIILSKLKSKKYIDYYKNLMYRLILNGESHSEERVKAFPETDLYLFISKEEKIRTCRDILTFIYLLNPEHLKMHFKNDDIISKIEEWISSIE